MPPNGHKEAVKAHHSKQFLRPAWETGTNTSKYKQMFEHYHYTVLFFLLVYYFYFLYKV